jgi:hypothetical protein
MCEAEGRGAFFLRRRPTTTDAPTAQVFTGFCPPVGSKRTLPGVCPSGRDQVEYLTLGKFGDRTLTGAPDRRKVNDRTRAGLPRPPPADQRTLGQQLRE